MGTSHSPLEFAGKCALASAAVTVAAAAATRECAQLAKDSVLAGSPARMRNVGKNGSKLGVRYTGGEYGEETRYLVFAVGKGWPILERGAHPHPIPRLVGQRSGTMFGPAFGGVNTRRKKPLKIGDGGGFAMHVRSPGSRGKHTFEHGIARAMAVFPLRYATAQMSALGRVF